MGIDLASVLRACRARHLALAAAGLLLSGLAQAFAPDPISQYGSGRSTITPTVTNPNWTAYTSGNDYKLTRPFEMAAPAGKKVPVTAYVVVPKAGTNGARRFMAKALKAVPLVGTGIAIWEMWDLYRCRPSAAAAGDCDEGTPPTPQMTDCWRTQSQSTCYASAAASAQAAATTQFGPNSSTPGQYSWNVYQYAGPYNNGTQWWYGLQFRQNTTPAGPWNTNDYWQLITNSPTQQMACQNAGDVVGPDGKCPTGVYEPQTLDYMENLVQTYPQPSAEELAALNSALDYIPYDIDGNPFHPRVEGSPTVTGNTTTTTGPNGTTTTTETYTPDESNPGYVDWTKSTTKTNPDNTTETTTETDPDQDKADPCKGREGTFGCTQVGEIPAGPDVSSEEKSVTIVAQTGWGADNASCPAFASTTFMGQQIQFDHSIICNFASGIRPAIIGVAWLIAALIVVGVRTSGEG